MRTRSPHEAACLQNSSASGCGSDKGPAREGFWLLGGVLVAGRGSVDAERPVNPP